MKANITIVGQLFNLPKSADVQLVITAILLSLSTLVISQVPTVIDSSNCTGHGVIVSNTKQRLVGAGENCSGLISWDIAFHVNAALVKDVMQRRFNTSCEAEVCQSIERMALMQRQRWTTNTVYLNVDQEDQLEFLLQFRDAVGIEGSNGQQIFTTVPSHLDASTSTGIDSTTVFDVGFVNSVFTPGPSVYDLAEMAYQFIVKQSWTYIAVVISSNRGDQLFFDRLQQLANSGANRLCLGYVLTVTADNVTTGALHLKGHVYDDKKLTRLSVVVSAPGEIGAKLFELTSGSDARFADSGHRYQWVLVGAMGRYVGQLRGNSMLGAVLIQPGIIDYSPATDAVASLVLNSTLKWLTPNFTQCDWPDPGSPCYMSALSYDILLLSLLPVISQSAGAWANASLLSGLRNTGELALLSLIATQPYYKVFTDQIYTRYSFSRGLYHAVRGYSAPAIKVHNVQLVGGNRRLTKIGEMIIDNNGDGPKRQVSLGTAKFYVYNEALGVTSEVTSLESQCFGVCPACVPKWSGMLEFSPGDFYIGVIAPIHYAGSDQLYCTDGTITEARSGGYQFALVVKFMVQVANYLGNASEVPPPQGLNLSLLDQQYISVLTGLLTDSSRARGDKSPRLGFVIVDSCYSGAYTSRNLNLLLNGQLAHDTPGLHYSKILGFVGALSSTCTMAAAEVLKQYGLPLISYGSTSTALNNTTDYPYVARTVVTDRVIIQSIVQLLQFLQTDYIAVVYADTDYGRSLRDQLFSLTDEAGICVRAALAHSMEDAVSNLNLARRVISLGARYVPFLGSLTDLVNFLSFTDAESVTAAITLITTEAVATSTDWLTGRPLLGAGCLSVGIDANQSPAFAAHQRSFLATPPANSAKPWHSWLSSYFESARHCYLANAYSRTEGLSVACVATANDAGLGFLEGRAQLAVDAASSLILGGLTAIKRICVSISGAGCDTRVQNASYAAMRSRGNLVLFGNEEGGQEAKPQKFGDYRRIYDDRTGSNVLSMWQYRNETGTGWGFVQVGSFSKSVLRMQASLASLQLAERPSARAAYISRRDCAVTAECVNFEVASTLGAVNSSSEGHLLALLTLLVLPGVALGFYGREVWLWLRGRCQKLGDAIRGRKQQHHQKPEQPRHEIQMSTIVNNRPLPSLPPPAPKPRQRQLTQVTEISGGIVGNGDNNNAPDIAVAAAGINAGCSYVDMGAQQPSEEAIPSDPMQLNQTGELDCAPEHIRQPMGTYENDT